MLAWVDHNDPGFGREVLGRLSAVQLRGATVAHYFTGEAPAGETDRRERRNRITDAWRWFLDQAEAPVILAAEDDTLPDADAYPRLLRHLEAGAVFAQGTEVARQLPYVPHWTVKKGFANLSASQTNTTVGDEARSASYDGRQVVDIQGGGWYCCAMRTEQARGCLVVDEEFPLGPDVVFVRELAKRGRCVGDWAVECGHFGETFHLHPAMSDLVQVRYWREGGRWQRAEHVARPYRQACQKNEEGLLRVRVLKTFIGSPEEREKYGGPSRKIEQGTIMDISDQRFQELGARANPIVVALTPVDSLAGSSLAGWAPVTKPVLATEKAPDEIEEEQAPLLPPPRRGRPPKAAQ